MSYVAGHGGGAGDVKLWSAAADVVRPKLRQVTEFSRTALILLPPLGISEKPGLTHDGLIRWRRSIHHQLRCQNMQQCMPTRRTAARADGMVEVPYNQLLSR
jgi:hypothetical protein